MPLDVSTECASSIETSATTDHYDIGKMKQLVGVLSGAVQRI
jgi:hypothetical protein